MRDFVINPFRRIREKYGISNDKKECTESEN
jgi:hypothetical protein